MKYIFVLLSILILSQADSKDECYCLNLEDAQRAMVSNCIQLKPNKKFIYWWRSDLGSTKAEGNWTREGDIISITTINQPEDYLEIERNKSEEKTDSVEIRIVNEDVEDYSFINLVKYSNDSIKLIAFNKEGIVKTKNDAASKFGVDFSIPWQSQFKLESNDINIKMKLESPDDFHYIFFKNERIQIKGDKANWIDKFEGSKNYWEKVDKQAIKRRFKD